MYGQFETEDEQTISTDTNSSNDSGLFDKSNKNTFRVLFSGNPGRAALYSLIIPGAGQLYNKRYWKIPLVYGALGGVGYLFYTNNDYYQQQKNYYISYLDKVPGYNQNNYEYYLAAKKSREQAIFAVIGVYLLNVFDAYIDRHLIDFDMTEDISLRFKPVSDGISPIAFGFEYGFK
jgi:hypothetical protein